MRYYLYDPEGNPVWEYQAGVGWDVSNLFFNGRNLVANTISGLFWRRLDQLGRLKDETNNTGQLVRHHVPFPFGESMATLPVSNIYVFASREQGTQTGLGCFDARYHGCALGQVTSIDPSSENADPANPQSWNQYPTTSSNPLAFVDPNGEFPVSANHPATADIAATNQRFQEANGLAKVAAWIDRQLASSSILPIPTAVSHGGATLATSGRSFESASHGFGQRAKNAATVLKGTAERIACRTRIYQETPRFWAGCWLR
jgi:RHS repeat-associated protein